MHERVLGKIVGKGVITCQVPQEIPDLGLVAANQLTERGCILCGDRARDEQVILRVKRVCGCVDQSLPAKRQMIMYATFNNHPINDPRPE